MEAMAYRWLWQLKNGSCSYGHENPNLSNQRVFCEICWLLRDIALRISASTAYDVFKWVSVPAAFPLPSLPFA